MKLRSYWTLSKRTGRPRDVRRATWVNGAQLSDEHIHGFDSELVLLDSSWLLAVLVGPDQHGPPSEWDAVEIQGDAEQAIVARKPIKIEGVFVRAYNELGRMPLVAWIERARASDDPELRKRAEQCVTTMEIAAEGYD